MNRNAIARYSLVMSATFIWLCGCEKPAVKLTDTERSKVSAEILRYNNQGSQALAGGDPATAEKMFLTASQQPGAEDLPDTARALEGLSFVQAERKNYDQAENGLRRAISIYEKQASGASNPALVRPVVQLATLYEQQGKIADEKAVLSKAVQAGPLLGPEVEKDSYICGLIQLGDIYKNEKQPLQAEALFRRALDLLRQSPNPNQQRINGVLSDLTTVLYPK